MRAVLDTNIFVAAFKKPGGPASRIIKDDRPLNRYTLLTSMGISLKRVKGRVYFSETEKGSEPFFLKFGTGSFIFFSASLSEKQ